ncbi:hypothetical protein [Streptomyces axinellae]
MSYDDREYPREPRPRRGPYPAASHDPSAPQGRGGGGGISDGLLISVLAFLLGLTLFAWTATGLAGLFAHGAWPDHVTFGHTPQAVRELITEPHNLTDAWPQTPPDQLSGYGLFWGIFLSQLMVLMVLTVFVMGTVARARAVRRTRRLREQHREPERDPARAGRETAHERPHEHRPGRHPHEPAGPTHSPTEARPWPGTAHDPANGTPSGPTNTSTNATAYGATPHTAMPPAATDFRQNTPNPAPHTTAATGPTPATVGMAGTADPAGSAGTTETPSGLPPSPRTPGTPATPPPTAHGETVGARSAPSTGNADGTGRTIGAGNLTGTGRGADGGAAQDPVAQILEAPGAVLVAAPTPALWAATKTARAKLGPIHLFDPTHACDTPDRLRWSPHHGCADRTTAASRATALLAPLRSPRPIDATTHTAAETVLRCWLHAAALEKKPFREVHRWALATSPASDPVRILRSHPRSTSGAGGELEAVLTGHPQLRADAVALIRRALAPLGQLHVRNACSAERADRLALESFIDETGTLYVVGEDPEVLPLLNALTQSVVEHGRRMAVRSSAGRLDPPLTTVLRLAETL